MSVNWDYIEQMKKKTDWNAITVLYGSPEVTDITVTEFGPTKGVDVQPKWDISEKIVINTAVVGAFYSKRQNPNHPITPDEIRNAGQECAAAGAPSVHFHVRNKSGIGVLDYDLFHYVVDPVKRAYPAIVFDACLISYETGDWEKFVKLIDEKLVEVCPVNPTAVYMGDCLFVKPPHVLIEKTKILQDHGVKPTIAIYTDGDIDNAERYLIKTKLLQKPYSWILLPGLPGGSPMHSPQSMALGLIRLLDRIREIDDEPVIVLCATGRASSYLATLGILLGLNIRVGMEDTIYLWPHSDQRIRNNAECFRHFVGIAEGLGRKLATPNEYRKMLGLPER
jgi:uncharacterized protein (DUF849 family)